MESENPLERWVEEIKRDGHASSETLDAVAALAIAALEANPRPMRGKRAEEGSQRPARRTTQRTPSPPKRAPQKKRAGDTSSSGGASER